MDNRGCLAHIVGGFIKGVFIGGILGGAAGYFLNAPPPVIMRISMRAADTQLWQSEYSECGGRSQSPVNIEPRSLVLKHTHGPLTWNNYGKIPESMKLENSGHSIHLTGTWRNSRETPYITGGPLTSAYSFSQLHFHWGVTNDEGSEHTTGHKRYPLEMHLVHSRNEDSGSSNEDDDDKVVVVSYMFEISKQNNAQLNAILRAVNEVKGTKKKEATVTPFPLDSLDLKFGYNYALYNGSLTTPPCTEGVTWILSSKPLDISQDQMNILRSSLSNGKKKTENFRPVQPLNGRTVFYITCPNC